MPSGTPTLRSAAVLAASLLAPASALAGGGYQPQQPPPPQYQYAPQQPPPPQYQYAPQQQQYRYAPQQPQQQYSNAPRGPVGPGFFDDVFNGPIGRPIGYQAYRLTHYELGYQFEFASWASPNGREAVLLSGPAYYENRGHFGNAIISVVLMVLAAASRRPTTSYVGTDGYYNYYHVMSPEERAADDARVAAAVASAAAVATERPLSFGARLYHSAVGSQMNGAIFDVTYAFWIPAYADGIVLQVGATFGSLVANENWPANRRSLPVTNDDGTVTYPTGNFERTWIGGTARLHLPIVRHWLGARVDTDFNVQFNGNAVWTVYGGLEAMLGNRIVARALAGTTPYADGAGAFAGFNSRFELGVKF